jgi:hypothetical protein
MSVGNAKALGRPRRSVLTLTLITRHEITDLSFTACDVHMQRQDTSDITRKVFERDRDKDGKPDFRVVSVFRGKERVMVV